ncbi:hypothetical protein NL676_037089 [Syzygium grande]|nr:hypothetical protein NL676_037089 [Syzygium grande]
MRREAKEHSDFGFQFVGIWSAPQENGTEKTLGADSTAEKSQPVGGVGVGGQGGGGVRGKGVGVSIRTSLMGGSLLVGGDGRCSWATADLACRRRLGVGVARARRSAEHIWMGGAKERESGE